MFVCCVREKTKKNNLKGLTLTAPHRTATHLSKSAPLARQQTGTPLESASASTSSTLDKTLTCLRCETEKVEITGEFLTEVSVDSYLLISSLRSSCRFASPRCFARDNFLQVSFRRFAPHAPRLADFVASLLMPLRYSSPLRRSSTATHLRANGWRICVSNCRPRGSAIHSSILLENSFVFCAMEPHQHSL